MLPLALGMVGSLARTQPLDPASWRTVFEKLQKKRTKFREMENGKLFSTIDSSLCELPLAQREYLQLMAVLASGVVATTAMLGNLWDQVCTFQHVLIVAHLANEIKYNLLPLFRWKSQLLPRTSCT